MPANQFQGSKRAMIGVPVMLGLVSSLMAQAPAANAAPSNEASMDMGASKKSVGGPAHDQSSPSRRESSSQAAQTYRETADGLRKAAEQASADEKGCYLRWAAFDEAVASALETGSQVTDPQPDCQLGAAAVTVPGTGTNPEDLAKRRAEQQRILDEATRDQQDIQRQLANLTNAVGRGVDQASQAKEEERLRGKLGVAQLQADQARKRLAELDRAAATPPSAPKEYAIPTLRADVAQLRFYASGPEFIPITNRDYATTFPAAQSQFIAFQVDLDHPAVDSTRTFTMVCTYTWPDGTTSPVEVDGEIEAGWTGSSHSGGKGWREAGHWKVGEYRVSCMVEGRTIASGAFQVQ
jgi:hypothetical protein